MTNAQRAVEVEDVVLSRLGLNPRATRGMARKVKRAIRDSLGVSDEAVRYARWAKRHRPPETPPGPPLSETLATVVDEGVSLGCDVCEELSFLLNEDGGWLLKHLDAVREERHAREGSPDA